MNYSYSAGPVAEMHQTPIASYQQPSVVYAPAYIIVCTADVGEGKNYAFSCLDNR